MASRTTCMPSGTKKCRSGGASEDAPGLATEAETAQVLLQKLKTLIPELLSLNGRTDAKLGKPFSRHSRAF